MSHGADCPNCGQTNFGGGYCDEDCELAQKQSLEIPRYKTKEDARAASLRFLAQGGISETPKQDTRQPTPVQAPEASEADGSTQAGAEFTQQKIRDVILEWKRSWMNVTSTDEDDHKNYYQRSFGVDANMQWDLAKRIYNKFQQNTRQLSEANARIAQLESVLEKVITLMSGAKSPAPLTDELVLKLARETLTKTRGH